MTLLAADLLVVDQVTSFMSNNFLIRDEAGSPVGQVLTEGSTLSRLLMGSRRLSILDTDGTVLMRVDDVRSFGRDRFAIEDATGGQVAELVQEFTFLRTRLSIHLGSGEQLEVQGSLFEYDFQVVAPHGVVARISRQWPGLAGGLMGHNRYVVGFSPDAPANLRAAALGAVVALDLIRAKQKRKAAASS